MEEISPKPKRIRRTRTSLEKEILDTVAKLVRGKGFTYVTLMDVANASKTDINVLRRNFGSLENLLDRYADSIDYWLRRLLDESFEEEDHMGEEWVNTAVGKLIRFLIENEDMQRLLVWQIAIDNPTARRISRNRDLYYQKLLERFFANFDEEEVSVASVLGILVAGIYLLILIRKRAAFCGVDYNKKEGADHLERAFTYVIHLLFDKLERRNEVVEIARKMKQNGLSDELIAECTGLTPEKIRHIFMVTD